MKAIILAAGLGSRLGRLSDDLPKCLMNVNGKSILQRQLDAYHANGINDISIVKGYLKEKIDIPGIRYFVNDNYQDNNQLLSLMFAEHTMTDAFVASFSDIIFESAIITKLLESDADITLVVDTAWEGSYEGRTEHPIAQADKVIFDDNFELLEIGKELQNPDAASGEFIGMFKCTNNGAKTFCDYFHRAESTFQGKPFKKAQVFQKAYWNDFFQFLTDEGIRVSCLPIEKGWHEIDTIQDYERVQLLLEIQ